MFGVVGRERFPQQRKEISMSSEFEVHTEIHTVRYVDVRDLMRGMPESICMTIGDEIDKWHSWGDSKLTLIGCKDLFRLSMVALGRIDISGYVHDVMRYMNALAVMDETVLVNIEGGVN